MPTWLDNILEQHQDFESPMNYWRWSALAALSATMRDQVYLDRWFYKVYPNIYVMLYGESGIKKGPPINMANKLVALVGNTNIIKGRSSIQAILKDMGSSVQTTPGGGIKKNTSSVFISSSELSSSLVEDPAATKILTDLFDRNYNEGEWRSLLKSDTFKLDSPVVSMLSGTNEAMSDDLLNSSAVKGGFFARTFIIHETKRNKRNSLTFQPDIIPDYTEASKYLKELSKLKGPFKYFSSKIADDYYIHPTKVNDTIHYASDVGKLYHAWYDDFLDTVDSQEVKDETGTLNRFGDSVIKVAMLLSLAEQPKLEITVNAMTEAIRVCEQLLGNVRKTVAGKNGLSTSSNLKALIVNELLNVRDNHQISRQMLTKKFYQHYGSIEELNHIMESFHVAGMILTETHGETTIYKMPESQVTQLKEYLAGKGNKRQ
jgi:hypothetical protein